MSFEFKLGIIKCPKCKKYFVAGGGVKDFFLWRKGDYGRCPYCSRVLSVEECRKNLILPKPFQDIAKKIEREQGDLKVMQKLAPRQKSRKN
jgi:DNA-directed RNA polymerase subunit RPC12/RpoP